VVKIPMKPPATSEFRFNHKPSAFVDTTTPVAMKALKYLTYVGKLAGFISALNVTPFVDPAVGMFVFAAASLLKDTVNRIGDLVDDGLPNSSFKDLAARCHCGRLHWSLMKEPLVRIGGGELGVALYPKKPAPTLPPFYPC